MDHYLEVEYDLSNVMFITTANSYNMPRPLLDRMEIITISGYTEDEKAGIARMHLISKQEKGHGLKKGEFELTDGRCRTSSATTPARRACGTWSARSRSSAARR
jgi:ATP-dependent Lon protease